jgi:hypothetical protein
LKANLEDNALLAVIRALKVILYNRPKDGMNFYPIVPALRERVFKPEKYDKQELEGIYIFFLIARVSQEN